MPAYRLANVTIPEEMDTMDAGMAAGHVAARAAINGAGRSCRSASRSPSWTTSSTATTRGFATASGPKSTSGG